MVPGMSHVLKPADQMSREQQIQSVYAADPSFPLDPAVTQSIIDGSLGDRYVEWCSKRRRARGKVVNSNSISDAAHDWLDRVRCCVAAPMKVRSTRPASRPFAKRCSDRLAQPAAQAASTPQPPPPGVPRRPPHKPRGLSPTR